MIPIAIAAKVELDPKALLENPWVHDMAHEFLKARLMMETRLGWFGMAPRRA